METRKSGVLWGVIVVFSGFLFVSCASIHSTTILKSTSTDPYTVTLTEAEALFHAGEYQAAADLLTWLAAQDYTQSRMDELLRWLGRCELCLSDPFKAKRLWAQAGDRPELPG